jgi:hypothetical protein
MIERYRKRSKYLNHSINQNNNISKIYDADNHEDCVVSFPYGVTFKIGTLLRVASMFFNDDNYFYQFQEILHNRGLGRFPISSERQRSEWKSNGMEAEILEPDSKNWKKGKVKMKIVLEFYPDESEEILLDIKKHESSLDDIRQDISKNTSNI